MSEIIVSVRDLTVDYRVDRGLRRALHGIDFEIREGEAYGLVGESGSGKSTVALALTKFLPNAVPAARCTSRGRRSRSAVAGRRGLRDYRRNDIGVVYQEPVRALNPTAVRRRAGR